MDQDRTRREELNRVTERIIGSAFTVSNELGNGFLEKVYENALAHELRKAGITRFCWAEAPAFRRGEEALHQMISCSIIWHKNRRSMATNGQNKNSIFCN